MTTTHTTIPPEALYWAVLDTASLPAASAAKRREQLGFLFERFLPRPIEEIQAAYTQIARHSVLACGIDHERLEHIATITLTPESIPPCITQQHHDPHHQTHNDQHEDQRTQAHLPAVRCNELNLLTGPHEPDCVRQLRRRWLVQLCAAAAIAFAFLLVGVEQRVHAAATTARQANSAIATVHAQALGPTPTGAAQFSKMTGELRLLRRTRRGSTDLMPIDPTPDLAEWLANWPTQPPTRTRTLIADDQTMTLTTELASNDDAQAIIDAMAVPPGWTRAQPTVNATANGVRLTLRAQRKDRP